MIIKDIFQYEVIQTLLKVNKYMTVEEGIEFLYFLKKTFGITYKQIAVLEKQNRLIDLYAVYIYESCYLDRNQDLN